MRELVTFQVGSYANFIGSHFWNFQDELLGLAEDPQADLIFKNQDLDMDVLYRTGETLQGCVSSVKCCSCHCDFPGIKRTPLGCMGIPTYTPRLISVDFQGSLGPMSSRGTLYNHTPSVPSGVVTWTGSVSTQASEPHKRNLFLKSLYEEEQEKPAMPNGINGASNESQSQILEKDIVASLEDGVKFWTDFSKVHYHPQSLYELNVSWVDVQQFDNYGIGTDVLSMGLQGDEINERLRFFIEECDHVQGIQFIVDDSGGFSGVAEALLENIADEYTNIPVLLYSVRSPGSYMNCRSQKQAISHNLHDAVSFSRLSSLCKLIVPVGLPSLSGSRSSRFLHIQDEKPYHSSAVYASAIHSISLPFRMKRVGPTAESCFESGAVNVNEGIQMLAGHARQNIVSILDVSMPAPSLTGTQAEQSLLGNLQPLTPETAEDVEDLQAVESITVHGVLESGGQRALVSAVREAVQSAYEHATTRPKFSHLSISRCPLPIPLPFPSIFGNLVGKHGELLSSPISGSPSRGSLDVHSIPMAARLRSSKAVLPFLENRLGNIRKYGIERGALGADLLRSWGFGKDELEDIGENLSKMIFTLDPRPDYSSDSD